MGPGIGEGIESAPLPNPSISVFFPCYNDSMTIGELVVEAERQLQQLTADYEVIVVNDGSSDDSAAVLRELAARMPRLRVITHDTNRGYGGALRSGFAAATKDLIFYTDGDAQYDPRELKLLLPAMTDNVDVVNGWKIERHDPLHRIVIGRLYHHFVKLMFGFKLRDVDCDFRLIRRRVLTGINLRSTSGSICVELVKHAQRAGAGFREVSVHHYARKWGQSQFFRPGRILQTYLHLAVIWFELMIVDKIRRKPSARIAA